MLSALRLLLGPILLLQGKQVRKNILRMPEPSGPRAGQAGSGPDLRVLIVGDSSAAGVGATTQAEGLSGRLVSALSSKWTVDWNLVAQTGWTTADVQNAVEQAEAAPFDVCVICAGVNDVTTETGLRPWLAQFSSLLALLKAQHGIRLFLVSGMPPMGRFPALPQPLRWYMGQKARAHDRALAQLLSTRADAVHMPVRGDLPADMAADDGFHPGPPVYAMLGEAYAAVVAERLSTSD